MTHEEYIDEARRRLEARFPASANFSAREIERFADALRRYDENGRIPPERWLLKEYGG